MGVVDGVYGGIVDNIRMRVTDVVLAVPLYLLLFVLSASFTDGSPRSVIILIAVLSWMYAARLVRGEFLTLKGREYVLSARPIVGKNFLIMCRHIVPNDLCPVIAHAPL